MRRFIRRTTTTITSATVTSTTTRHRSRSASVTPISHRHAVRHHHATRSRFHIWKGRPSSAAPSSLTTSAPLGKALGEVKRGISSRSRRAARQHLYGQTGASVRSHHWSADTLQDLPQPARKNLVGASRKRTVHHVAGVGAVRDDADYTGATKEPRVEQLSDE